MSFIPLEQLQRCKGQPAGPQGLGLPYQCTTCARRLQWNPPGEPYMETPTERDCPKWVPVEGMGS